MITEITPATGFASSFERTASAPPPLCPPALEAFNWSLKGDACTAPSSRTSTVSSASSTYSSPQSGLPALCVQTLPVRFAPPVQSPLPFWFGNEEPEHVHALLGVYIKALALQIAPVFGGRAPKQFIGRVKRTPLHRSVSAQPMDLNSRTTSHNSMSSIQSSISTTSLDSIASADSHCPCCGGTCVPERGCERNELETLDEVWVFQREAVPLGCRLRRISKAFFHSPWDSSDGVLRNPRRISNRAELVGLKATAIHPLPPYYLFCLPVFGSTDEYVYSATCERHDVGFAGVDAACIQNSFCDLKRLYPAQWVNLSDSSCPLQSAQAPQVIDDVDDDQSLIVQYLSDDEDDLGDTVNDSEDDDADEVGDLGSFRLLRRRLKERGLSAAEIEAEINRALAALSVNSSSDLPRSVVEAELPQLQNSVVASTVVSSQVCTLPLDQDLGFDFQSGGDDDVVEDVIDDYESDDYDSQEDDDSDDVDPEFDSDSDL